MIRKSSLTTALGRVRTVMRCSLVFVSIAFAVLAFGAEAFAADPFYARALGDYGNVSVIEVSGNYDEYDSEGKVNSRPRELIAREFYATHKDEYDFLVIFTDFDIKFESEAVAFYLGVKNDTLGIGNEIFDNGYLYGSGGKLQGTIDMGNVANLATSPVDPRFDFSLDTLAHEMLHRWGAHVKFLDSSGELSTALLGKDGSHWSYLLDSNGSLEYGNNWEDNGDGTFTSIAARKYFSPLDLYLMGMIDSSEVPPMLLIENPDIDPTQVSSGGDTISGTPRYVTIEDIIAAEGERVPNAKDSRKQFKMAFVLATSGALTWDALNGIENIRKEFLSRFSILTDGKGLVRIVNTLDEELPTNPGVQPVEPTPRTLPPSMDDGVSWLLAAQDENGNWGGPRTTERDTAVVVETLENLSVPGQAQVLGLQWLAGTESGNTDYLAAKITALAAAGHDVSTLVDSLLALQNPDGGWGSGRNFLSNPIDTCSALKALSAAYSSSLGSGKGADYLLARQNPDGGWGYQDAADSNVLVTAEVSAVLQDLPATNALVTAVDKATAFLRGRQNLDGGFGNSPSTVYETALAFMALSGTVADETVLRDAVDYISTSQNGDGSWNDEPYSTALAVKALQLAGTRLALTPTTVALTGTVIDGATNQPLSGAVVSLQSDPAISAMTSADGSFSLLDVPQEPQTVAVSLDGYATETKAADVSTQSVVDLGTISLVSDLATGRIKGVIISAETGEPLAGVSLTLIGAYDWSGETAGDGSFIITDVTPGNITISAALAGYRTGTATGTIKAGRVLTFSPKLEVMIPSPTTGAMAGTVADAATGEVLAGVSVTLLSDPGFTTKTDGSGNFVLSEIPQGERKVEFSLSGYNSSAIGMRISAGATVNLGTVGLSAEPSVSSIRGTVSDAASGLTLSGTTVTIGGAFGGTTVTGNDGSFAVSDVAPGGITVTVSKDGYYPVSVSGTVVAGAELFLNPRLTPMPPEAMTGTMTGTIVDALTDVPLAGVAVTLRDDASVSTTSDAKGVFTLLEIPPGTRNLDFSLQGYAPSSLTVDIPAGAVVDTGTLPLFSEPTTGMIKGTINEVVGEEPLSGVTVTVTGTFSGSAVTAADGSFVFAQVAPGSVTVTVEKSGYRSVTGTGTIVAGGVLIFSPRLTLVPPEPTTGTLVGQVVDRASGLPLPGVAVAAADSEIRSETDETGRFVLADIPEGSREINFSLAGYSSITAQVEVVAGFVIDLKTLPLSADPTTGVLKGRVTDSENGQPVEGATLALSGSDEGSVVTGADGVFLFPEVAAGEVSVSLSRAGYYPLTGNLSVAAGSVQFFNFQLTAIPPEPTSGTIVGRIVDGLTNLPLNGVSITLESDSVVTSSTDEDGGFMLADVPPGKQTLRFVLEGYAGSAATFEVPVGFVVNLGTLPLSSDPTTGMIKGGITDDASEQPLSGVSVEVSGSFTGSIVTGADGTFIFPHVEPGEVVISMSKGGYEAVVGSATVNAGGVFVANVRMREAPPLPTTGELLGKVLDGTSFVPISGAAIYFQQIDPVYTNDFGEFAISDLEPGSYEISVSAPGYSGQTHQVLLVAGPATEMRAINLMPLFQSTMVTGTVTDASTGSPIVGADVVIPGTNMSTRTDALGRYDIAEIHLAEFGIRASVEGYDAAAITIKTSAYVMEAVDFSLTPSESLESVTIDSLVADKQAYTVEESVTFTVDVKNGGTAAAEVEVAARIIDQQGNIVALLAPVGATPLTVAPLDIENVTLQWGTGHLPPGTYLLTSAVKAAEGGNLLDTRDVSFVVEPALVLTNAGLRVSPTFTYAGKEETVKLAAILSCSSNVVTEALVEFVFSDIQGNVLRQGATTVPISQDRQVIFEDVDLFSDTFAPGEYVVEATVSGEGVILRAVPATFTVLPDLRIDMSRNVDPTVLVPDGDGKVRMTIELKGGEK
jgi:hypothetical protein